MGCGCGGKKSGPVQRLSAQVRGAEPGVTWEWVTPQGKVQEFDAKWQAEHAQAMAGGRIRRVTTGPDHRS